jgi:hypothetical protein
VTGFVPLPVDSLGIGAIIGFRAADSNATWVWSGGTSSAPSFLSVSPTSALPGASLPSFTVTGSDVAPASTLPFSGTGVAVDSYSSRATSQIAAAASGAANAPRGKRDLIVSNPDGQSATLAGGFGVASTGQEIHVLVDASRDGGAWWAPQWSQFDPNAEHQGKALADYLRSRGAVVTELPRGAFTVTSSLLDQYDLVIRPNEYLPGYSSDEISAYQNYVSNRGRLILLSDYIRPTETDTLAASFGLDFRGISRGENVINRFASHPITSGVSRVVYIVGSGLLSFPQSATILGYLSSSTFIDLDDNGTLDPGEPSSAPVMGIMQFGLG